MATYEYLSLSSSKTRHREAEPNGRVYALKGFGISQENVNQRASLAGSNSLFGLTASSMQIQMQIKSFKPKLLSI